MKSTRIYTGVSNRLILSNIRFLVDSGRRKDIIIRLPVIPTITDTDHNVNGIAEFLASLKLEEIHLLPFHDVKEKYERLGMPYKMTVHSAPSQERMKEIKERFEEIGMKVVLYG
jgi:Pyruvate-formate lyase-activating enzyme